MCLVPSGSPPRRNTRPPSTTVPLHGTNPRYRPCSPANTRSGDHATPAPRPRGKSRACSPEDCGGSPRRPTTRTTPPCPPATPHAPALFADGGDAHGLLPHHFLDHIVGRTHKRLDRIHRPHRRHLLLVRLLALATTLVRQRWQAGPQSPLPAAAPAHQGHPFAIGRHHQERSFVVGVRNRKAVLKISTSLACSRLRSSDALTAISKPKIVPSFRIASA